MLADSFKLDNDVMIDADRWGSKKQALFMAPSTGNVNWPILIGFFLLY